MRQPGGIEGDVTVAVSNKWKKEGLDSDVIVMRQRIDGCVATWSERSHSDLNGKNKEMKKTLYQFFFLSGLKLEEVFQMDLDFFCTRPGFLLQKKKCLLDRKQSPRPPRLHYKSVQRLRLSQSDTI